MSIFRDTTSSDQRRELVCWFTIVFFQFLILFFFLLDFREKTVQGAHFIENILDRISAHLNKDPADVRLQNSDIERPYLVCDNKPI